MKSKFLFIPIIILLLISLAGYAQFDKPNHKLPQTRLSPSYHWWKYVNPTFINGFTGQNNWSDSIISTFMAKTEICLTGWVNNNINLAVAMGNDSMRYLRALTNLQKIRLRPDVSDVGIAYLDRMPNIKDLEGLGVDPLGNTYLTNQCMPVIGRLTSLERLHLFKCININDVGLQSLSTLINLKDLTLTGWNVTDAGMYPLLYLTNLRILRLDRTKVTGECLKILKQLPYLEDLNLEFTSVDDQAITELANFPNIKILNLSNTPLTDRATNILIAGINQKPGFQKLIIYRTGISTANKQHIARSCRGVQIIY